MQPATTPISFPPSWSLYFVIGIVLLTSCNKSQVGSRCIVNRGFHIYTHKRYQIIPLENKQLINHQIQQVNNMNGVVSCGRKCSVHKYCMSFNYDKTSGVCQLNDADADMSTHAIWLIVINLGTTRLDLNSNR